MLFEENARRIQNMPLLLGVDRLAGESVVVKARRAVLSRFDFDKDERVTAFGNEVNLAVRRAKILCDDFIAVRLQIACGNGFTAVADAFGGQPLKPCRAPSP